MSMSDGSERPRLRLKRQTGWFAAGQEVDGALQLLSDAAFKVFMWLCLHAERSCGSLCASGSELALALGRQQDDVQLTLNELQQKQVCTLGPDNVIEICDRFWPYQRTCDPLANDAARAYVEAVKGMFLARRCVHSSFTAADEKLALSLHRRGVSLIHVEHAILLGTARKYTSWLQHGSGTPISSLHYFTGLLEEVRQNPAVYYWTYIAQKVKTFEQTWTGFGSKAPERNGHAATGQKGGMCRSTDLSNGAPSAT